MHQTIHYLLVASHLSSQLLGNGVGYTLKGAAKTLCVSSTAKGNRTRFFTNTNMFNHAHTVDLCIDI